MSRREKLKFSDVRFHVDFHATVRARSQELSWKYTTPGVKGFDVIVNAAGADSDKVNRVDMAEVSYARMRTEATTQILDRIKLDLCAASVQHHAELLPEQSGLLGLGDRPLAIIRSRRRLLPSSFFGRPDRPAAYSERNQSSRFGSRRRRHSPISWTSR